MQLERGEKSTQSHNDTGHFELQIAGEDLLTDGGRYIYADAAVWHSFRIIDEGAETFDIGAQSTVCGGGRYDGLLEELGGNAMPALGFALGIERLLMLLEAQGVRIPEPETCGIFIASMGDKAHRAASALTTALRSAGIQAEFDVVGRGLRAQMKYADKLNAKYSVVLGDNEIEQGSAKLKNMRTGEQHDISLDIDAFIEEFVRLDIDTLLAPVLEEADGAITE